MNKIVIALFVSTFAFGFASTLAQLPADKTGADNTVVPLSKLDAEQAKAARAVAKAKWAKMTPEEKAAAKEASRRKRLSEASAMDMIANGNMSYDAEPGVIFGPLIRPKRMHPDIDMQPLSTLNTVQIQVARAKANERWARMTPEAQATAKKAAAAKKQEELTALDEMATPK